MVFIIIYVSTDNIKNNIKNNLVFAVIIIFIVNHYEIIFIKLFFSQLIHVKDENFIISNFFNFSKVRFPELLVYKLLVYKLLVYSI